MRNVSPDAVGAEGVVAAPPPAAPRRRRWPPRLVIVIVALLALAGTVSTFQFLFGPPRTGYFRSLAGRDEYVAAYEEAMGAMPAPTTVHDLTTRWGTVRAYEWTLPGTEGSTPVVLLPGRASGAPMWSENLAGFGNARRVVAVDALGDAGLSVQGVPMASVDDQAAWLHEVLDVLAPDGAHLVGHSFGAATASAYARHHPDDVVSLTLLEPVLTFGYPPARMTAWAVIGSLPGLPDPVRETALGKIGGADVDLIDPMARMVAVGSKEYVAALPTPQVLADHQSAQLTMPVYVAIASRDSLAGGERAAVRARSALPDGVVEVWPDTSHSLPMEVADLLGMRLQDFWAASEPAR